MQPIVLFHGGTFKRPKKFTTRYCVHARHQRARELVLLDNLLLQQWNKSRKITTPKKALADDLTAGASRLSHAVPSSAGDGTDQSELSENAKMIFEAALKYDIKSLQEQGGLDGSGGMDASRNQLRPPSRMSSLGAVSNLSSNIPYDFATWFDLPSPGSMCIPLLPMLNISLHNFIDIYDSSDVSPQFRVDDVVSLSYSNFACESQEILMGYESDVDIYKQSMGPIIADGDNGSIRFANASIHLPGISNAAHSAISRRDFQEAEEIYNTLLRSCQTSKSSRVGLVGQLIASTLNNLSVLHMWNQDYERAMPYCRESLRVKTDIAGDDGGSINVWANIGLLNYAMGSSPSALAAFRKAVQMSSKFHPDGYSTGRLVNNMAVANFEIVGKLPLVTSQLQQALQLQRGDGGNDNNNAVISAGEDLFSTSVTIFNIGVVHAAQREHQEASSHLKACHAMQKELLEPDSDIVRSTAFYIDSMKSYSPATTAHIRRTVQHQQPKSVLEKPLEQLQEIPKYIDRQANLENQDTTESTGGPANVFTTRASQRNPFTQGSDQISHTMICLGSLKAPSTAAQKVKQSLDGVGSDNPNLQGFNRGLSLLCRRPINSSPKRTISQSVAMYGLNAIKKREAQSELQRNLQRYGPRHPDVGKSHNNLGLVYLFSGDYAEAVSHLDQSIRINTNALGPTHQDIASTLMFKGIAQFALDRLDDSMTSMTQVRRMREDLLGHKHPETGQILNNIACVQFELGENEAAESLFQEALDLQREAFTTDPAFLKGVSIVLCNIAFLHAKSGSFPKALIELEGALQIRQDILLEDNTLNDIQDNMAHILAIQQYKHGAVDLEAVTEEYKIMLRNKRRIM